MEQPKFNVKGTYTIIKRRGGKIIQEETFHNTILNEIVNYFGPEYRNGGTWGAGVGSLIYDYSGPIMPNTKNNDIRNAGGSFSSYFSTQEISKELNLDLTQLTWHKSFTVPANSSNVGTITGVLFANSMSFYNSGGRTKYSLFSAALVTDSEGAPISIEKTQYDEITVTAAWQWTAVAPNSGAKALLNLVLNAKGSYDCLMVSNNIDLTSAPPALQVSSGYLYTAGDQNYLKSYSTGTGAVTSTDNSQTWTASTGHAVSDIGGWQSDYTAVYTNPYVNSIVNRGNIQWLFPNSEIFPVKTFSGVDFLKTTEQVISGIKGLVINGKVTTGDGTTTDYIPSLPAWVENSEKVYKNGTLLTRDVDYLVDSAHNMIGNFFFYTCATNFINFIEYYVDGVQKPLTDCTNLKTYSSSNHFSTGGLPPFKSAFSNSSVVCDANESFVFGIDQTACFSTTIDTICTNSLSNAQNFVIEVSTDNKSSWQTLDLSGLAYRRIAYTNDSQSYAGRMYALKQTYAGVTHIRMSNIVKQAIVLLGHVGDYAIRFIDPPAEGDVLTITCDIDRPIKNFNNALTINTSWTLTI